MKLKEYKTILDNFDDDITVCIADWGEQYMPPSEIEATKIDVTEGDYISESGKRIHGKFLRIGDDGY